MPVPDDDLLSLRSCISLVRLFHQRIKAPIAATPRTLKCDPASALLYSQRLAELAKEAAEAANGTTDVLLSRLAMTLEEIGEWLAAHAHGDVASAADALGDRLYLLIGDAVATGLPLSEIFEAVHQSNLSKLPGVTTGMGKGVKGSGYQRPDLATLLATLATERKPDEADMLLEED